MSENNEIESAQIDEILKGITIPSPPQIMADLQMEMVMPDPDLSAMADLISKDAGLSGSVLKTVNSPFFGLRREIVSIKQAVTLLGIKTILNLVNAYFLRNEMSGENHHR
ncbi:HDOD domain-containing protein [Candidatus Reidiella endopervernicosa]|uniref:HDOD domain-containing protein n=1 Tax=Candidatus Reidiella endopervernicosa TaxID=2738883 RepID=UPI0022A91902|nr:HDOD domain-containing protein [Candidatus Reidiella endopervernicosa]